ncbi:winged helix-turn-helix domain-containing protein [Streptomyces sp. NPDC057298]|uniref:winged helix-turn-helix domain-containing protein n=1 Tax=Streptomyces sp. NPDC057298 TaxID=3346091 RepID=UPI0036307F18
MTEGRAVDGGGREFERVLEALRTRIADGSHPLGSLLPPQRQLAEDFDVSRDTVQRVLRELRNHGWIASRQGSGSRVVKVPAGSAAASGAASASPSAQTEPETETQAPGERGSRPHEEVILRPLISEAFERPHVTLDVYTLTSESLDAHIRLQEERIRRGAITPQSITLRLLLPSDAVDLPYPRNAEDPSDPRPRKRLREITGRQTASLNEVFRDLRVDGLVPSCDIRIRRAPLAPAFKLYLLNGVQALHGVYQVVQRPIEFEDGERIDALDVLGLGATLSRFDVDDDPGSHDSVYVAGMNAWFESVWTHLSE